MRPRSRAKLRRGILVGGASIVGAAAAFLLLSSHGLRGDPAAFRRGELLRAFGEARFFAPRLAGAPYGPATSAPSRDLIRLLRARRTPGHESVRGASVAISTALQDGDRAVEALFLGCPREAVRKLARAVRSAPNDSRLWNDLAAAHQVAAEAERSPRSVLFSRCPGGTAAGLDEFDALEAASRSLALSPSPEARYNRALALEALHLDRQAALAWEEVEATDPDPGWAAEAARRRGALSRRNGRAPDEAALEAMARKGDEGAARELARAFPQRARQMAGKELLESWSRALLAGQAAEADRLLGVAEVLARSLAKGGDPLPEETTTLLRRADLGLRERSARGFLGYADAFLLYRAFKNQQAIAALEACQRDLYRAGLPQALEAELYAAAAENNAGRPAAALVRISSVEDRLRDRTLPSLSALAAWIRALIAGRDDRPYDQLEEYRRCRALFERIGDLDRVAAVDSLLAQALQKLGRRREAWRIYLRAASAAPRVSEPYRRRTIWGQLAFFAQANGRFRSGLALQDEMMRAAAQQGDPNAVHESLLLRAALRSALGDEPGAKEDLETVRRQAPLIEETEDRERTEADLDRIEGTLAADRTPAAALTLLDRAIDHYDRTGQGVLGGTSRAVRARARAEMGNLAGAEEDLATLIARGERGGSGWLDRASDEERYTFGREVRRTFEEMVRFQVFEAHRPWRAFSYAETGRELLAPHPPGAAQENGGTGVFEAPGLATLRAALPADTVLVEFAVFNDRTISWLIAQEGAASFVTTVAREELAHLAESLDPARGLSDAAWNEASARLFDLLLRPLYGRLGTERTLVVVPDGPLSGVPWSGLRDRKRNRYLIEDRAILVNPSLSFYLRALARSRQLSSAPAKTEKALIVGDPAFDFREWPAMKRLNEAAREAREIGALHGPNSIVLTGEAATWEAFRTAAQEAGVIHLGMHAVLDPVDPFRSFLLFADRGPRGARTLRDLTALKLPKTRLAFLAACESAGEVDEGEGVIGLARPFLAAGVPTVVGTLWNVEDRLTRSFTVGLYRASITTSLARALRREIVAAISARTFSPGRFSFFALGS